MASNYEISAKIFKLVSSASKSDIDKIAKKLVDIYGASTNTILKALKSRVELSKSTITVISARSLSESQKKEIEDNFKDQASQLTFVTDKTIVGGLIVKRGDNIIDNSLSTRIKDIQELLSKSNVTLGE